jgi:hypothetical protein
MTLPPFPLARYRLDFTVETAIRLPEYAGSALRGAFGGALRRTACMTREKDCKACLLYRSCPYPAIFEPPSPIGHALQKFSGIPAPFVIEPPAWGERQYAPGDTLTFHLVVVGRAIDQLSLILFAMQRALGHGVGSGDGTAQLARVSLVDADSREILIMAGADAPILPHTAQLPPSEPAFNAAQSALTLEFHTPLRLQRHGPILRPDTITPRDLLINLVRRIALISEFHLHHKLPLDFAALAEASTGIQSTHSLTWRDWTRYSSRQQQEMKLGGCIGRWRLHGELTPFLPFIHAGRWLHAGKNATFGLGHYTCLTQ